MDIFSKINQFANTAGGKASGAFELGKITLKIAAEEKKIGETTEKIGECILLSLDEGQTYSEAVTSLYEDITASRAAILAFKAQMAQINGNVLCTCCQTENSEESKFCKECGCKIEEQPPIVAEVVEMKNACPACGAEIEEDSHFCTKCGKRVEEAEVPEEKE